MFNLDIPGSTHELDLQQIERWAIDVPASGTIVEVGAHKGRSTVAWALSCDPSVTVYGLDIFYEISREKTECLYDEFIANTQHIPNIVPVKTFCPYVLDFDFNDIDVLFLDASHSNPFDKDTLKHFLPKIKSGGLLCGHDYWHEWKDVIENVEWLEQQLNKPVTLYPGTTLWSFRI